MDLFTFTLLAVAASYTYILVTNLIFRIYGGKIENLCYDFTDFQLLNKILRRISRAYHSITGGILNLIKWAPIIYNDRDWDNYYLLTIIHKKLESMEKFFNSEHAWGANATKKAKKIKIAKNLCKRLIDDEYLDNALTDYYKKYGKGFSYEFEPCKDGQFNKLINKNSKNENRDFSKAGKHSDYMEQQDYNYLFKLMSKYIQNWWD